MSSVTRWNDSNRGYTIIELLEFVVAGVIASQLAGVVSSHLEGAWRSIVYYAISIVGTLVIGLSFLLILARLFPSMSSKRNQDPSAGDGKV